MKYLDTVELATVIDDGYGDKTVTLLTSCKALFVRRKGVTHQTNADGVVSNAAVYLDPKNSIVVSRIDDLEDIYIKYRNDWYSVETAHVAERKLLNNAIDNVYCLLNKEPGVAYVTYVS